MIPPDQTVRDAVANLAMTFRGMVSLMKGTTGWFVSRGDVEGWAARLEWACKALDAEKTPLTDDEAIAYEMRLRERFRDTIRTLSDARRAEAWEIFTEIYEGAVSPTAPPAEQDTPQ